jgi:hypothetical protein
MPADGREILRARREIVRASTAPVVRRSRFPENFGELAAPVWMAVVLHSPGSNINGVAMATALVILQPVWDCRWSRPGHRLTGVPDAMQPEGAWVCVREGKRRQVTEKECRTCAYWEVDPALPVRANALQVGVAERSRVGDALAAWTKVVLLLTALLFVATGVVTLTGPLAVPFTVSLWLSFAVFAGLAAFWRPHE